MTDLSPPGNALIWVGAAREGVLLLSHSPLSAISSLRLIFPLFSVFVIRSRPISVVLRTCVPPSACASKPSISITRTSRISGGSRFLARRVRSDRSNSSRDTKRTRMRRRSAMTRLASASIAATRTLSRSSHADEHMQRGVVPHDGVPPLPLHNPADGRPGRGRRPFQDMPHALGVFAHLNHAALAAGPSQQSHIRGLAAAANEERRAVQRYSLTTLRLDSRIKLPQITVVQIEQLSHRPLPSDTQANRSDTRLRETAVPRRAESSRCRDHTVDDISLPRPMRGGGKMLDLKEPRLGNPRPRSRPAVRITLEMENQAPHAAIHGRFDLGEGHPLRFQAQPVS